MSGTATHPPASAEALAELHAAVRGGRVILPGAPEYDRAHTVYVATDRRPAAVVRAADTADVVATVGVAREHGLETFGPVRPCSGPLNASR